MTPAQIALLSQKHDQICDYRGKPLIKDGKTKAEATPAMYPS